MKFSLVSDLHVNHPQPKFPYDLLEETVVVAGDTDNGLGGMKFLQKLKNKGHKVFATTGNHDHYSNVKEGRTLLQTEAMFVEEYPFFCAQKDNIIMVLLNGWYPVTDAVSWFEYMNDGRFAVGDDPLLAARTVSSRASADAHLLEEVLKHFSNRKKFVVVTHTAPCEDTLDPRYEGSYSNEWYWNPLMRDVLENFSSQILVWCHGHTHSFADKIVSGVRVVCNPRGYPGENLEWKPFTIEV